MGEAKKNIDDVLSYHYKEMARISNIADSHIQGVFGDFKLLMAVGGMLSWKPIHDALNLGESNGTQFFWLCCDALIPLHYRDNEPTKIINTLF